MKAMTKAELIQALDKVPDDYIVFVYVANRAGDVVESQRLGVRVLHSRREVEIHNDNP